MEIKCSKCKETKTIKDFYKNGRQNRSWCKKCICEYQCERWKARKKKALDLFGGACSKCGYNKNLSAIDFHHIDPNEKEFGLQYAARFSWDRFVLELKKCVPLCRNCHAEHHNPNMAIELIDANLACKRIDTDKYTATRAIIETGVCKCGKPVYGSMFCSAKCSSFYRRKVERPTKENLAELIKKYPYTSIAKQYGVSDKSIIKWAKAYQII